MSTVRTFTKKELTNRVSKKIKEKSQVVEKVISETFTVLREVMAEAAPEIHIEIRDFGVLEVKKAGAKPAARNPHTGELVYVPAHRKTHFKPGKLLKEELKQPL